VLDADLPLAVDILSDMVTSSLITPKDVDAERNVVLEEIAMNDDDPSDTVHEAFTSKLFGDTPLGGRSWAPRTRSTRSPGTRSSSTTRPGTRPST
jgi:Predicted Zn-dependent peptidases